jgi:hypothetical protein
VSNKAGFRKSNFAGSSVAKVTKLSFQDLAGYFDELQIWIPDARKQLDDWAFANVEVVLHPEDNDRIEEVFSLAYDLEFWSGPYSIADFAVAIEKTIDAHDVPFAYCQRNENTAINGLGLSLSLSLSIYICR